MNENRENVTMTQEELFTMEGYEKFKEQMAVPEANRESLLDAYLNIIGTSLII